MNSKPISQKKILNATKWSSLAEIAARIAAPIVNMVLARVLTPDAFGIVASITIITSFADIFTDAGFQKYIVQHEYQDSESLEAGSNVAFTSNLILSTFIYIIIFIFKKPLATAVGCGDEYWAVAVSSLTVLCTCIPSVAVARFRRDLDFKPLFFIRITGALIPIVVTVPLALIFRNFWALIIGTLLQKFFIAIATIILSKWKPRLELRISLFKEMIGFSIWNLMETLSIWFAGQANIFIVSNTLNPYYLGLYKTAMSAVNSCLGLITAAFTPVFFSTLSRFQNDKTKYNSAFDEFQFALSLIVIPLGFGLFMYKDIAIGVLLGNQWTEATMFLGLWSLVSTITIVYSNTACEVYRSYGKPNISFFLQMGYLVFYIPAILYSAKAGFSPLTYTSSLIRLLPVLADIVVLHVMFGVKIKHIFNNTAYNILCAVIMSILAYYLRKISSSIPWIVVSIIVCAIFYFGINLLNPRQLKRVKRLDIWNKLIKKQIRGGEKHV